MFVVCVCVCVCVCYTILISVVTLASQLGNINANRVLLMS